MSEADDLAKRSVVKALHVLIAYHHLDLAGVRPLTDAEFQLGQDIADWMERRKRGTR